MAERAATSHVAAMILGEFKAASYSPNRRIAEASRGYFTSMIVSTQSRKCMSFESISAVTMYTPGFLGA